MLGQLLHVVLPVFGVAAAGWLFAGFRRLDLATLTDVVLYLAAPALVFHSLASRSLTVADMAAVGGGAVVQVLACGAVAWAVFRAMGRPARGLMLAAMFPNTGNLGLPLALFAFGQEGLAAAVIVFTAITVVHYSLGLMVVSGTPHPADALKMPLLHAAVLGILVAVTGLMPPAPVMRGLELLGEATVPTMLLSLGVRMRSVKLHAPGRALLAVALRMVPGLLAALGWVWLLGLDGPERGVVVVTGVLPSAVMNFVLAEAYDQQGDEVAAAILIGTVLSIAVIPVVLATLA
jgi:predicted permease